MEADSSEGREKSGLLHLVSRSGRNYCIATNCPIAKEAQRCEAALKTATALPAEPAGRSFLSGQSARSRFVSGSFGLSALLRRMRVAWSTLTAASPVLRFRRAVSAKRDYYEVLGLAREANEPEIKRAYRKKAMEFHPDRNPGDHTAEERFKEAAEAFEVLQDPQKRQLYDQYGHEGPSRAGFSGFSGSEEIFSHFGDLFGDLFGNVGFSQRGGRSNGPSRGADLKLELEIGFIEAIRGCEKEVQVPKREICGGCTGTGAAKGSKPKVCPNCRGSGQAVHRQGFFTLQTTCPQCRGQGQVIESPCKDCSGTGVQQRDVSLKVKVPAGIDDGQTLRIAEAGQPGLRGGPAGHLYVQVHVEQDERFARDGYDVHSKVNISMFDACLGCTAKAPSLEGDELSCEVEIPAGTQPGEIITRKGKGVPELGGRGHGDHHVHVQVEIPRKLSSEQSELLREASNHFDHEPHKRSRSGFFDGLFGRRS